jgi:hypothetical protein
VPPMPMFADQLPLLLVPTTRREAMTAAIVSHVAGLAWIASIRPNEHPSAHGLPFVLAGMFLPALVMLLRRRPAPLRDDIGLGPSTGCKPNRMVPHAARPAD